MTIHYHGCPITPRSELLRLAGRFFCTSFAAPQQVRTVHEIGQGNMLDNGAFTTWRQGRQMDWRAWFDWVSEWLVYPTTWCVLPDSIDGGVEENDRLLREFGPSVGVVQEAPVWHLHEPVSRLVALCSDWSRVCFGSSGMYAAVGSDAWHRRVSEAFDSITDQDGRCRVWVHMLRGMALSGSQYPFASVDSTDVARNHHLPHRDPVRMVERWDSLQNPGRWVSPGRQLDFEEATA